MAKFVFSEDQVRQFERDGCLIVEDFLNASECDLLRKECSRIIDEMNPEEHKEVFSTTKHEQMTSDYLLHTSDKIGFFWEAEALDENGKLKRPKHSALNKMGHAFHIHSDPFKHVTFATKVQTILHKLGFVRPVIPQSMYIFKPPGIGAEVKRHIDASFLYSEPLKLVGFWIALEDATLENGCLSFAKGSHKTTDVSLRMVRNPKEGAVPTLLFEGSLEYLPFSEYHAAPVKKGSLVLIDGKVQHCSDKNTSENSRHIYTFHVTETYKSVWSKRNWLQPTQGGEFAVVYDDSDLQ